MGAMSVSTATAIALAPPSPLFQTKKSPLTEMISPAVIFSHSLAACGME
jgi:hypothetical protein